MELGPLLREFEEVLRDISTEEEVEIDYAQYNEFDSGWIETLATIESGIDKLKNSTARFVLFIKFL